MRMRRGSGEGTPPNGSASRTSRESAAAAAAARTTWRTCEPLPRRCGGPLKAPPFPGGQCLNSSALLAMIAHQPSGPVGRPGQATFLRCMKPFCDMLLHEISVLCAWHHKVPVPKAAAILIALDKPFLLRMIDLQRRGDGTWSIWRSLHGSN